MNEAIKQLKKQSNFKIIKLIFYTLFIMVLILLLLIGSHNYYKKLEISNQQQNILNVVTTVAQQLEEFFKAKDEGLLEIINRPQFQQEYMALLAGNKPDATLMSLFFNLGSDELLAIELLDQAGDLVKAYSHSNQYSFKKDEDIQQAVKTQKAVYYADTKGERSINIIQPIEMDDLVRGFVRVKIDTNYINEIYLANYQLNRKGYISLKDSEGRLFLHPSEESIGENVIEVRRRQFPDYDWSGLAENVRRQLNRETGVGSYYSIWPGESTRIKKLSAFAPCNIGDTFIILNFSADYIETMTSFRGITNATVVISLLLIVTSIFIIFYIYRIEIKQNELALEAMYFDELKEKNALLLHQSKFAAMGEMLATIAHQLKQPLNALKLSIYNLEDYHTLKEDDQRYLETLLNSNHRLIDKIAKTIDDFQYFFKPQPPDQSFNLYEAIAFSIELNMVRINDLGVDIQIKGSRELVTKGESNIFSQVMLNLLNNSIDALKDQKGPKEVVISLQEEKNQLVIELTDNGGGIQNEVLEKLFSPFVTSKGENGTGLGLYISRYIVREKFNGELTIENTPQGVKERIMLPKI
ncbi:sensor histidine kinase [Alkaliphilus crotonatoxidans]